MCPLFFQIIIMSILKLYRRCTSHLLFPLSIFQQNSSPSSSLLSSPTSSTSSLTCSFCGDIKDLIQRIEPNCTLRHTDLKTFQWSSDEGKTFANQIDSLLSESNLTRESCGDAVWQKKAQEAQEDVLYKCQKRIEEVERQCAQKVNKIERECSERLLLARMMRSDSNLSSGRIPSAPLSRRKGDKHKLSVISL